MTSRLDEIVVRTQADLERMWRLAMGPGGFARRSLWIVLLDEDGRPQPVIMPVDGVPSRPGEMAAHLPDLTAGFRVHGEPVLLLSRPGPGDIGDSDRAWARVLAPLTTWPVHLATRSGVRAFAPDDLTPTR